MKEITVIQFAGLAMQALMGGANYQQNSTGIALAAISYYYADAMLKASEVGL